MRPQVSSTVHVHGHSHVNCDVTLGERRYVSHQLMAPCTGPPSLLCVWRGGHACRQRIGFDGCELEG